jgi:hypothetical protein
LKNTKGVRVAKSSDYATQLWISKNVHFNYVSFIFFPYTLTESSRPSYAWMIRIFYIVKIVTKQFDASLKKSTIPNIQFFTLKKNLKLIYLKICYLFL